MTIGQASGQCIMKRSLPDAQCQRGMNVESARYCTHSKKLLRSPTLALLCCAGDKEKDGGDALKDHGGVDGASFASAWSRTCSQLCRRCLGQRCRLKRP